MSEYTEENPLEIVPAHSAWDIKPVMAGDIIRFINDPHHWLNDTTLKVYNVYKRLLKQQNWKGIWIDAEIVKPSPRHRHKYPAGFKMTEQLLYSGHWDDAYTQAVNQREHQQYRQELEAQIPSDHDILGIKDLFNEL
ncbi:MAG: hypothetical protein EBU90_25380 [Proteobacteria bacterium]|nr:hypothetical protein [Pseudomonadota bacterium]